MARTYPLYEAKAKLSAIVKQVRDGQSVIVTLHGKPVVEIRPIPQAIGLESRMRALAARGILVRTESSPTRLKQLVRKPGALERFLEDREG